MCVGTVPGVRPAEAGHLAGDEDSLDRRMIQLGETPCMANGPGDIDFHADLFATQSTDRPLRYALVF